NPVRAAGANDRRDAIEVRRVVAAALGLEPAPADGQAKEVEAELLYLRRITVVEDGDRLERQPAIGERRGEESRQPGGEPAQRHVAPVRIEERSAANPQQPTVEGPRGGAEADDDEQQRREGSSHREGE